MKQIEFEHRPPSTNAIWRHTGKRTYRSKRYMSFIRASESSLGVTYQEDKKTTVHGSSGHTEHDYTYGLIVEMKLNMNMDASNYVKALEDFLVRTGLTPDDKHAAFSPVLFPIRDPKKADVGTQEYIDWWKDGPVARVTILEGKKECAELHTAIKKIMNKTKPNIWEKMKGWIREDS